MNLKLRLLVWIFVITTTVSIGYFGFIQYQDFQKTKDVLKLQQSALEEAQQEIEKLNKSSKSENIKSQTQVDQPQQELKSLKDFTLPINEKLDIQKLLKTVVMVVCKTDTNEYSAGSGTIIQPNGIVLTNAHVVDPYKIYNSGTEKTCLIGVTKDESDPPVFKYIASVQSVLHVDDLSFLKIISTEDDSPLPLNFDYLNYPSCGTVKTSQLNDKIFIIGYPKIGQGTFTITDGIISGSVKPWHFKTSAKIDHGNSGGAAVNANGQLIGVPTYGVSGELESLGYIINLLGGKASCS